MQTNVTRALTLAALLALPLGTLAQQGGGVPQGGAPFAGASKMTLADALKEAPKQSKDLQPLDKKFREAEAKLKKKPKDDKLKKAYVEAAYNFGHAAMTDPNLSPPVKYRAALALYNKALAVDPKHKASKDEKKQIEDIYQSMGRPVPK